MAQSLISMTSDQASQFDLNVTKKIFCAPEPLIYHLQALRPKLASNAGVTRKELEKSLEYVRFNRYKSVDMLPNITHMPSYHKQTEKQIQSMDVVIEIFKQLLAQPFRQPKVTYDKPRSCPICLESLETQVTPLSCGHWVHEECMKTWDQYTAKNTCVVCKKTKVQHTQ
jgi:hypothetical protein